MGRRLRVALFSLALAPCAPGQVDDGASLAYKAEMMADSKARAQQQGPGGPTLFGGIQLWYVANLRSEAPADEDDFTSGFVMRRVKLGAENRAGAIQYRINGVFSRGNEFTFLEDAWIGLNPGADFFIRAGQFKLPLLWEESTQWHDQLAAERSYTNDFFNQGYSQGVDFGWAPPTGEVRTNLSVSDGLRTANTDIDSLNEADIAFTGRVDWLLDGKWDTVRDFTSEFGGPGALRLGAAGHFQNSGRTGGGANRTEIWFGTVDAQWEHNGWSLFGAGVIQYIRFRDLDGQVIDLGLVGQVGYRYNERNEVFGRVDTVIAGDRPAETDDDQLVFTAGYNHYFDGARAKFTTDFSYFTAETLNTPFPADTGQGFLRDNGSPQLVLRIAVQFVF